MDPVKLEHEWLIGGRTYRIGRFAGNDGAARYAVYEKLADDFGNLHYVAIQGQVDGEHFFAEIARLAKLVPGPPAEPGPPE